MHHAICGLIYVEAPPAADTAVARSFAAHALRPPCASDRLSTGVGSTGVGAHLCLLVMMMMMMLSLILLSLCSASLLVSNASPDLLQFFSGPGCACAPASRHLFRVTVRHSASRVPPSQSERGSTGSGQGEGRDRQSSLITTPCRYTFTITCTCMHVDAASV